GEIPEDDVTATMVEDMMDRLPVGGAHPVQREGGVGQGSRAAAASAGRKAGPPVLSGPVGLHGCAPAAFGVHARTIHLAGGRWALVRQAPLLAEPMSSVQPGESARGEGTGFFHNPAQGKSQKDLPPLPSAAEEACDNQYDQARGT